MLVSVALGALGAVAASAQHHEAAWAGRGFDPPRLAYETVMRRSDALFELYACFFRHGLCLIEGMPTDVDETANGHLALRERLLGPEWARWTADAPFWASGSTDRVSVEHFEVDTRSEASKAHGVWRRGALPLHTDGSHLSVGPRMKLMHVAELEAAPDVEPPASLFADARHVLGQLSEGARRALRKEPGLQRRCCAGEAAQHVTQRPVLGDDWVAWNVHDVVNATRSAHVMAAVRAFEAALDEPSTVLELALRPGTAALVDNFRVLHGRGAMGPMRRVMVGFEAPNAPVEAAWARLRYPTSTQAKFANGSLEGDGRSTRVDLAAALRLLDQNGQSDLAAGFFAARHPHHRDLFYAADHGVFWEEALPSDFQLYSVETGEIVTEPGRASRAARPNAPVIPIARSVFGNYSHINAIVHAHGPASMALAASSQNEVLPISEHAFMFYERVGYVGCDFFFGDQYVAELVAALREPGVFALQMRNHAYLMTGSTIQQTYMRSYMFEKACDVQLKVMASGAPPHLPPPAELEFHRDSYEGYPGCPAYAGDLEWPGLRRQLERRSPGWDRDEGAIYVDWSGSGLTR